MKTLILVRHAEAESKRRGQNDMDRKLTASGQKDARAVGRILAVLYERVHCIMSSKATRAVETADAIAESFPECMRIESDTLNPGCGAEGFRAALAETPKKADTVIWVGHEPDFSEMLGGAIGGPTARFKFKKLACAELVWDEQGRAELAAFVPPRILEKCWRK